MIFRAVTILAAILAGGPAALAAGARDGGRWRTQRTRQPRVEITPKGDGVFVTVGVAAEITFQTDARSDVTGLGLKQNCRELTAACKSPPLRLSKGDTRFGIGRDIDAAIHGHLNQAIIRSKLGYPGNVG